MRLKLASLREQQEAEKRIEQRGFQGAVTSSEGNRVGACEEKAYETANRQKMIKICGLSE